MAYKTKEADRAYHRRYYAKHRAAVQAKQREYDRAHAEENKARCAKHYAKNRKSRIEYGKRYWRESKAMLAEQRAELGDLPPEVAEAMTPRRHDTVRYDQRSSMFHVGQRVTKGFAKWRKKRKE